jgi:NAD(P)-dependent dehydrogenase (short-subunit alcohol dehydrogenase family)
MELTDKVALVTGAASGLGLATSQALLAAGARVLAVDVDEGRLQQQFGELSNRARHRVVDVSDDLAVQAAVAEATDAWGALHIAVNCAGILGPSKTLSKGQTFPPKLWNRVIGINLTGTFNVVRHAALAMTANQPNAEGERGVIVNTASGAAWQGQMGQAGLQREQGRRHRPDAARGTRPGRARHPRHGHRAGAVRDRHVRRDADEGVAAPDRPDHPVPDAHGPAGRVRRAG